tara:strand:- start:2270 stop:2587 length:318 start_codon:yes stop_codon:yes gene_type:complete
MNLDETIFYKDHKIAIDELGAHIKEVTFHNLMMEFCEDYENDVTDNGVDYECDDFAVVTNTIDEEVHIQQIYNHDTGEIYWEDKTEWTANDETLVSSLLMYGELN